MPPELIDALGPDYMRGRPSYARCVERAKKAGFGLTYEQFKMLREDPRTLAELVALTEVDQAKHDLRKLTTNTWAGNVQVKAEWTPRDARPPIRRPRRRVLVISERRADTAMRALLIPDVHVGFRELVQGEPPQPFHDEAAMGVTVEVARVYQPRRIQIMGDLLDLPTLSKYLPDPRDRAMVQFAINRAYLFLADLRAAAPASEIVMLGGNHDDRVRKKLAEHVPDLAALCRAGEDAPVMSLAYLLRLDELKVRYAGDYGAHDWLDDVMTLHGEYVGAKGGLTAAKMLDAYTHSSACGHVHRAEIAYRTVHLRGGAETYYAMSMGTLAHTDGRVPGSTPRSNWQQGLGVIWSLGSANVYVIRDGVVCIDGRLIGAREGDEEIEDEGEEDEPESET